MERHAIQTRNDIRLLIADDHVIIRRGLRYLLDQHYKLKDISESDSCLQTKDLLQKHPFTHVILDLQLSDGNVMEILSEIMERHPDIAVLIYSMSPEEIFGERLIKMGVNGYLNKQVPESELVRALDSFFDGKKYMSEALRETVEKRKSSLKNNNLFHVLSERELTVMQYLLRGQGIKEISNQMNIKSSTVATFKARIFNKLNVSNIIELKNLAELYSTKSPKK